MQEMFSSRPGKTAGSSLVDSNAWKIWWNNTFGPQTATEMPTTDPNNKP